MLEDDYILEIIAEFGRALRKLHEKKSELAYEQLQTELSYISWRHAGLPYDMLVKMPERVLLEALQISERSRPWRYALIGDLMSIDAGALEHEGRAEKARVLQRRALNLYINGIRMADAKDLLELRGKILDLLQTLGTEHQPPGAARAFEFLWDARTAREDYQRFLAQSLFGPEADS